MKAFEELHCELSGKKWRKKKEVGWHQAWSGEKNKNIYNKKKKN